MMAKCCIEGCDSKKFPGCDMTFHGFPSDEELKAKWIEVTRVTGSVKYKRICPLHFKNDDFIVKGTIIHLKHNVVPTFLRPPFNTYSNDDKVVFKINNDNCMTDYEKDDGNIDDDNIHLDIRDIVDLQEDNDNIQIDIQCQVIQNSNVAEGISRCKCCLESDRLKSMWQENCSGGLREVYGLMLIECFALPWSRPENTERSSDLICEPCIARLKDAVSFKTEVLASEQLLSGQAVDIDKLKQDRDDFNVSIQTEYLLYEDIVDNSVVNDEVDDRDDSKDCHDEMTMMCDDNGLQKNTESNIVFPIKSETLTTTYHTLTASIKQETSKLTPTTGIRKRKHSVDMSRQADTVTSRTMSRPTASKRYRVSRKTKKKGLKKEDELIRPLRKRLTKREIADFENLFENLRKSTEAVKSKRMTQAKAALVYNVPQELLAKEIRKITKLCEWEEDGTEVKLNIESDVITETKKIVDDELDSKKTICKIKDDIVSEKSGNKVKEKNLDDSINKSDESSLTEMKKQANNIATILEFTNATPIRRHGGIGYGCCFCNEDFPDAADLKQHTIKEHDVKVKRNYVKGKRPSAYLVKLDITGLKCNLCGNAIDSLELLYDHFIQVHKKLVYKNAKNYIVPFKFDHEELRCLFCEFICNSFKGLLEHMSVHYRNHICEICDAGFLTKNNLFNHAGRHKKGTFKCDHCPKIFDTSSKKAGHQRLVHSSTNGVNRCGYCGEMFGTYRRKEKHLITEHGITLKKLKCKACDKTFETQTALRIHTKRDHLIERRFTCSVCDKRCFTNVQLSQHTLKHTGVKKFQCSICSKTYGRKSTLREHLRIHQNDRRFKCELCGMAFVQKCSWRGHMLSKHGQQVTN